MHPTYDPFGDVLEFHEAFSHPIGTEPNPLDPDLVAKRLKWMREELDEFELWASRVGDPEWDQNLVLAEMYDAMIDELYFVYGTLVAMNLRPEPGFRAVHAANMAKLHDGPDGTKVAVYNEDGKVVKPEGWEPPSHLAYVEYARSRARRASAEPTEAVDHGGFEDR